MRHGSLFSGIGGFDLAAEWMGWDNIFHCEWNDFGQRILKYYWPKAISYGDISKTDFNIHRGRIDILTGGFPCQPYSQAGKRLGKEDDRHLWPEMLRAVREIRPKWIVGENVFGIVNWNGGLVFDEVQADLEAEGYEVQPYVLPACAKNAPHRRDRVWFVAHSNGAEQKNGQGKNLEKKGKIWGNEKGDVLGELLSIRVASDSYSRGLDGFGQEISGKESERRKSTERSKNRERLKNGQENYGPNEWKEFPLKPPVCNGNDGISYGLDTEALYPHQPSKRKNIKNGGFSKWRNESIKAGGNAIVPQVAYELFKVMEKMENL